MLAPEVVIAVGLALVLGTALGDRFRIPGPVVLVVFGSLLAIIPALDGIGLPSNVVLFVFLPVLVYWECQSTSLRVIRHYLHIVIVNGTLLVIASAAVGAVVLHLLGVAWGAACVIGAALAPTDATALAALGRGLPRSNATVLQAEGLINDGMALVLFTLALSLVTGTGSITAGGVARLAGVSFGGGLVVGLATGWLAYRLRLLIHQRERLNVASVLTPFVSYVLAEAIGASGVLAVVVCGLFMSQVTPRTVAADVRTQGEGFWTLATYVLNGALFVLVGLVLPHTVRNLSTEALGLAVAQVLATYVALILTRFLFAELSVMVVRALEHGSPQQELRPTVRYRVVHALAGFRGGVSLAMALSVPATVGGRVTASHDLIIFVTADVVVLTLVVQGFLLPRAIRWADLPTDDYVEPETRMAQARATTAALDALPGLVRRLDVPASLGERMRKELQTRLEVVKAPEGDSVRVRAEKLRALRLAVVDVERSTVVNLRDAGTIDDVVLREVQSRLDLEEIRAQGPDDDTS